MVCWRGGFITQHHNKLHSLEAEMLSMVCNDGEIELVCQEITVEILNMGANRSPDARLDTCLQILGER